MWYRCLLTLIVVSVSVDESFFSFNLLFFFFLLLLVIFWDSNLFLLLWIPPELLPQAIAESNVGLFQHLAFPIGLINWRLSFLLEQGVVDQWWQLNFSSIALCHYLVLHGSCRSQREV